MAKKVSMIESNIPLSQFGVLVAQLQSIVASAAHKSPDPLLCFDLLSDLISAINDEPKEPIMLWQRKCEDALFSLLVLGARRPVRHLASLAMVKIIWKGDPISIYSRVSALQGFLADGKRSEPQCVAGVAQCLGELYRHFGRKITSGFSETTSIASKLMKSHEEYVRKEALHMLRNAMEGCGGASAATAYTEAFRLIMRFGVVDKSPIVRIAAARCLKTFANVGGPGLGTAELDSSAFTCVKAFNDPNSSIRDAFAEALGAVLALGMNPEAQVQLKGKGQLTSAKKLEDGLQRHLVSSFVKASGVRSRDVRISLTLAWVSFLQAILLKYLHPDSELQDFTSQVMDMLRVDTSVDAQALACVLYILRVGVVDQMTEPTQRSFLVILGKQLESPDSSPPMKVAALRTLSYTLNTLGEVPLEFREVLDDTVVAALSHPSQMVRVEAALTLRALAEVDPTCVSGLVSYGVTMLSALRESVSFDKGNTLKQDLDSLHGQATLLAALVSISPKLALGYPARLPHSVLKVSQNMLTKSSRNPGAATTEKEAGWLLLASLLASIPIEELEDQTFDILALWAPLFSGNPELEVRQSGELTSKICVWSAAIDALTAFVRCFLSPKAVNYGILLQPVLVYLSSVLSHISFIAAKNLPGTKAALDVLVIRTLITFQSLSDPMTYRSDHPKLLQLCTGPFRDPSSYEESSSLRLLLDKRDAWLGPWIPGRDWFEDELRAFQGGKNGLMPCIWDPELPSFPEPESVSKMLVNQKLLCFGTMFAVQDTGGMQSLLGVIEQSLKAGKKQSWHATLVNNICVGLLAGLKALLSFRPQPLSSDILSLLQNIFQNILSEGDISASVRRASSEGLGLLSRLGSDTFTARMTKALLGDLAAVTDSNYAGSIAVALGCIHRSAGGMALSSLVPATVSSISSLAKSSVAGLQIWSLHGLLLTIEAAGLSYISHVQATLNLGLEILLSEENGWVDLQQGIGRLINAIVAVLGPELAPGSIFFSHCKSVIAEISSCEETATLLENVRFSQQLVLFAPQALSVHSHVQTLLPTLSSRQPTLRHLAISTLRHLIEKDSVSVIQEQIEENLFHMLDEETDREIGSLIRSTIMRLLYASGPTCPSHWISVCRKLVLATSSRDFVINSSTEKDPTNASEVDTGLDVGEDDDNMVASGKTMPNEDYSVDAFSVNTKREKNLRYKTRVFAAECLSHLPTAAAKNPAHFDLSLARKQKKGPSSGDWLVLQLQELVSLAYQISTIKFESMQPIGVGLLSTIMDKFGEAPDPELPGGLLLEQYQAQLVSALRSALNMSSSPILLEAGLQLATKILTSGIIRGDQAAVKRIFSLISRPLNDFEDLYYPSFAEWVSCKIKIRLLAAHASLKCYTYTLLRGNHADVPDEYMALLPLFSKSSSILGKRWIGVLKDYCYLRFNLHLKKSWKPFLEGIKSPLVASNLKPCLDESWPVILQAVSLDAVPADISVNKSLDQTEDKMMKNLVSGYSMVELNSEEFKFLWGLSLLLLFQGQNATVDKQILPLALDKSISVESQFEETKPLTLKLCEILLPVFRSLCAENFFSMGFLTTEICRELLQALTYAGVEEDSWDTLAVSALFEIVHNSPDDFLKIDSFVSLAMELCLAYLYKFFAGTGDILHDKFRREGLISELFTIAKILLNRFVNANQLNLILAFMIAGYKCARSAATEASFSKTVEFVVKICVLLNSFVEEKYVLKLDDIHHLQSIIGACQNFTSDFAKDCIEAIHLLENRRSNVRRLLYAKLAFCLEQMLSFADLVYKMELCPEKKSAKNVATFLGCTRSIQLVIMDANLQVQAIGLQVLKNMVQKSINSKVSSFPLLLTGELFSDIFMVIQEIMRKPVTRESAALAGECLRTLVLMQTLPKEVECQKGLMSLILEAVVMILSSTENSPSEETIDLRNTAIRLVSHVAQVPSAAEHLKEVLLGMPVTLRQQIQNIIRASVTQEHQTTQVKPNAGTLEIKLPHQSYESKEGNFPASSPHQTDDDFEDDDDWDAFQSFAAATNATTVDSVSNVESPSMLKDDAFQEFSGSAPSTNLQETVSEPLQNDKEEVLQGSSQKIDVFDSESNDLSSKAFESGESDDLTYISGGESILNDNLASSDSQQPSNSSIQVNEINVVMEDLMNKESPSNLMSYQVPADPSLADNFLNSGHQLPEKADCEASNLEVDQMDADQSMESAGKSILEGSADNESIVTPDNVDSCSELSVNRDSVMTSKASDENFLDSALQTPENLADLEASNLEVDKLHSDQSPDSANDSVLKASADNESIVAPGNVNSCSEFSRAEASDMASEAESRHP
ncbi:protein SWEETIE-like isoform X1 [Chenopodium quinoa]|uniref:protein SWEETIE-like isoform X1 n=2 Tax=Chenopodium quinoa TaxID=63459 RepID=UPI000B79A336|nr:protein SWEETIE-like isoform X1 [Chenopodium quinoa]